MGSPSATPPGITPGHGPATPTESPDHFTTVG
jgi:hypothetical protein